MKFINDNNGYVSSIFILLLLLPIVMLLLITIEQNNHFINRTSDIVQSNRLNSVTKDFQDEIILLTKETMNNVTLNVILEKRPLINSSKKIVDLMQEKIIKRENDYYAKTKCKISCTINEIKASDNPFEIEVDYTIKSSFDNNIIQKNKHEFVEITDSKYPVYDPLPTLKTGITPINNIIDYKTSLSNTININNSNIYINSIQGCIIKKCVYNDYQEHGHNNITILNCLRNHYYHESHDGLCILCRLENKTSCSHMGLETFIIPSYISDKAPASIDHVLLNSSLDGQYEGNKILINNSTVIYLDNGHKTKYNL